MKGFIFLGLCVGSSAVAQVSDSIVIAEVELIKRLPIAKEVVKIKDLEAQNLASDLPILLKNQVSVLSSSDTGNGVGYSDFRIRGVGGAYINVMLNGVPYNDADSQGTFFVNMPDLASSASQIVVQRGVGTSANGVASFGASVNILTKDPADEIYFQTDLSYGSFNTQKQSFELGSGSFLKNKLSLMARYSLIKSDGYVDRAFSDLQSYHLTAMFKTEKTKIKFLTFGGKEKTYQAWNGVDEQTYQLNRKYNFSGEIYGENGEINYYDNETDNYRQNHYHLIFSHNLSDVWTADVTLHYTKGRGFYENYKQSQSPQKYNLLHLIIDKTDFIRKKWLDNDFYGIVYHFLGNYNGVKLHFGGAVNEYVGHHFGQVNSAFGLSEIPQDYEYYRNRSVKNDFSTFGKAMFSWGKIELFGDVQFRFLRHRANVILHGDNEGGDFHRTFNFVNPKAGVNYRLSNGKVYFSYALAYREPNRDDILAQNDISHETLHDFELGFEKSWKNANFFANAYFMDYRNQLVFSGKIDNVGAFIRENSGKSYRLGLEIGGKIQILKNLDLSLNFNWSENKNLNFYTEKNGVLENLGKTTIALSPNFIGNFGIEYKLNKIIFWLKNQYVAKQYLDNSQSEKLSLSDYNVLDFGANYHLKIKNHDLNIYFNLNNLWNKMYANKGYVYDNQSYYFPQSGRNFILGLSWKLY